MSTSLLIVSHNYQLLCKTIDEGACEERERERGGGGIDKNGTATCRAQLRGGCGSYVYHPGHAAFTQEHNVSMMPMIQDFKY